MTMVERCARKIEPLAWAALGVTDTQAHARKRESSLRKARDVLEAMREPSAEMANEGRWPAEDDGPVACWKAMIAAALAEHDALDG